MDHTYLHTSDHHLELNIVMKHFNLSHCFLFACEELTEDDLEQLEDDFGDNFYNPDTGQT